MPSLCRDLLLGFNLLRGSFAGTAQNISQMICHRWISRLAVLFVLAAVPTLLGFAPIISACLIYIERGEPHRTSNRSYHHQRLFHLWRSVDRDPILADDDAGGVVVIRVTEDCERRKALSTNF